MAGYKLVNSTLVLYRNLWFGLLLTGSADVNNSWPDQKSSRFIVAGSKGASKTKDLWSKTKQNTVWGQICAVPG